MVQELSARLQSLASAIRAHPGTPQVALCGFDLWLEVLASPHAKGCDFVTGGVPATGQETPDALKVPVIVIGRNIVISFDPTLAPDAFLLKP